MFNTLFSLSSVLGFVLIIGAIAYFVLSIRQVTTANRSGRAENSDFRILQAIVGPILLFMSGAILVLQGWRLDPLLLSKDFMMSFLIGYLIFLDVKRSYRNSK